MTPAPLRGTRMRPAATQADNTPAQSERSPCHRNVEAKGSAAPQEGFVKAATLPRAIGQSASH